MTPPTPVPSPSEATAALKAEIEKHLFTFGAGHCNLGQCAERILEAIPATPQQPHPVSPTAQPDFESWWKSFDTIAAGIDWKPLSHAARQAVKRYAEEAWRAATPGSQEGAQAREWARQIRDGVVHEDDRGRGYEVDGERAYLVDASTLDTLLDMVEALPTPPKAADLITAVHEILGNGADEKRWPPGMDDHEALWRYVDYLRAEAGQVEVQPAPVDTAPIRNFFPSNPIGYGLAKAVDTAPPIMAHVNMDPNASPETVKSVEHLIRAAHKHATEAPAVDTLDKVEGGQ